MNTVQRRRISVIYTLTGIILFTLLAASSAYAQNRDENDLPALDDILPELSPTEKNTLINRGRFIRFHSELEAPSLLPKTMLGSSILRQINRAKLNLGSEGLFFASIDKLPASYAQMDSNERLLILYNILRSISTLSGTEYYSASRGKMRLLFAESWVISHPNKHRTALADPLVTEIPAYEKFYIHQKDMSFGKNQSEMTFKNSHDSFATSIVNISKVFYKGLIKVVDPGGMQTHFMLIPVEEGIVIYVNMSAKTVDAPIFEEKAENSLTNRIIAISQWYQKRLREEFTA